MQDPVSTSRKSHSWCWSKSKRLMRFYCPTESREFVQLSALSSSIHYQSGCWALRRSSEFIHSHSECSTLRLCSICLHRLPQWVFNSELEFWALSASIHYHSECSTLSLSWESYVPPSINTVSVQLRAWVLSLISLHPLSQWLFNSEFEFRSHSWTQSLNSSVHRIQSTELKANSGSICQHSNPITSLVACRSLF